MRYTIRVRGGRMVAGFGPRCMDQMRTFLADDIANGDDDAGAVLVRVPRRFIPRSHACFTCKSPFEPNDRIRWHTSGIECGPCSLERFKREDAARGVLA